MSKPSEKECLYCGKKEEIPEGTNICSVCHEMGRLAKARYFNSVHGYKQLTERAAVEDWAKEMHRSNPSIEICKFKENPVEHGTPDVFAEMNGEKIGVEVTILIPKENKEPTVYFGEKQIPNEDEKKKLVEELKREASIKGQEWWRRGDWTPETLQKDLKKRVQTKNGLMKHGKKGPDGSLSKQFLLIDVLYLDENSLATYLDEITLPRPDNFDAVYMMGPRVSSDSPSAGRGARNPETGKYTYSRVGRNLTEGYRPLFEVCLST